ncbi:hypothetical protein [Achromobacter denitrificans]|uniref:hypothetical protein n=1 Tax=Achromobacter denitrificans TaxID=32002 RepID=UPI0029B0BBB8|nr:hypothetical protein [Achromobacter sp.]
MNQNNAAHIAALEDLRLGVELDRHHLDDGDAKLAALDAALALLSKLRAPVDERAVQEYGSPADVAQRIEQYLYHDGRKNSATQLLYEAMKALRALQGNRNDE